MKVANEQKLLIYENTFFMFYVLTFHTLFIAFMNFSLLSSVKTQILFCFKAVTFILDSLDCTHLGMYDYAGFFRFNSLTELHFQKTPWPEPVYIAPLCGNGKIFG